MPTPKNVHHRKFKQIKILYNLNGFSVAWGVWDNINNSSDAKENGLNSVVLNGRSHFQMKG